MQYSRLECSERFIKIATVSLVGDRAQDPLGEDIYLGLDSDLCSIGNSVLKALSKSRDLSISDEDMDKYSEIKYAEGVSAARAWIYERYPARELFDNELCSARVDEWVKEMLSRYGYKSRKKLYENIQCVGIERNDNFISFNSWVNGWHGNRTNVSALEFSIPASSSFEVVGAAAKYAIGNCRGKGADLIRGILFPKGQPETFEEYLEELGL